MKNVVVWGLMGALMASVALPAIAQARQDIGSVRVTFAHAVAKAEPAVVNIYAARVNRATLAQEPGLRPLIPQDNRMTDRIAKSLGSGVIVKAEGVVVTNLHVIDGAQAIKVVLSDGREFPAKKIGQDEKLDLAVLQIERKSNERLPVATFGNSETLRVGDVVLAIGNPFGIGQSVSFGIVSAVERSAAALSPYARFIQTDAPINPGNSTGALVGVNSGIFSKSGSSNGIGFAIPVTLVKRVVEDITTTGYVVRPWFGAEGQAVTPAVAKELNMVAVTGVQLTGVLPNSPAARAGLQTGDVILKLGGGTVENPADLNEQILAMPNLLNKATQLVYWRNGRQQQTDVTLTAMPERNVSSQTLLKGYNPLSGVTVEELSPSLNTQLNLPLTTKGVVVSGLPSEKLGAFDMPVQEGDMLMAINGSTIRYAIDAQTALNSSRSNWDLRIMRGGRVMNIKTR
jgi:Do/DeqQ family serine protease